VGNSASGDAGPSLESRVARWGCLAVVLLAGLWGAWALFMPSAGTGSSSRSYPTSSTVAITYKVSGTTTSASLTYENADGGTEQCDVTVPWSLSMKVPRGQFVYLSAQNQHASGTIKAEILVDGKAWKSSESQGAYVIASASGSAGN
jgi:hypothetical protein